MKKTISLLLVLVMCLSLCACGSGNGTSGEKAIVGVWKSVGGIYLEFRNDGTVVYNGLENQWTYNKDANLYTIHAMLDISVSIQEENGIRFFEMVGMRFYHEDDYEKGVEVEAQAAIEEMNSYTDGKTKIEIGASYDYAEDVTVVFLGASVIDDGQQVYIDAVFTSAEQESDYFYFSEYTTRCIHDEANTFWVRTNLGWDAAEPKPDGTVNASACVYDVCDDEPTLDQISVLICFFEMNGVEYYMDLTEYIK